MTEERKPGDMLREAYADLCKTEENPDRLAAAKRGIELLDAQAKLQSESQAFERYYDDPRETPEWPYENREYDDLNEWEQLQYRKGLKATLAFGESVQAYKEKYLKQMEDNMRKLKKYRVEMEAICREVLQEAGEKQE